MTALAARAATFALVALVAAGCVTSLVAETPEQRAYAAISEYTIVLTAAAEYAESPASDAGVVRRIAQLDEQAQAIIRQIQDVIRLPGLGLVGDERTLEDLAQILDFLRAAVVTQIVGATQ